MFAYQTHTHYSTMTNSWRAWPLAPSALRLCTLTSLDSRQSRRTRRAPHSTRSHDARSRFADRQPKARQHIHRPLCNTAPWYTTMVLNTSAPSFAPSRSHHPAHRCAHIDPHSTHPRQQASHSANTLVATLICHRHAAAGISSPILAAHQCREGAHTRSGAHASPRHSAPPHTKKAQPDAPLATAVDRTRGCGAHVGPSRGLAFNGSTAPAVGRFAPAAKGVRTPAHSLTFGNILAATSRKSDASPR